MNCCVGRGEKRDVCIRKLCLHTLGSVGYIVSSIVISYTSSGVTMRSGGGYRYAAIWFVPASCPGSSQPQSSCPPSSIPLHAPFERSCINSGGGCAEVCSPCDDQRPVRRD